jgi:hypothetical protein
MTRELSLTVRLQNMAGYGCKGKLNNESPGLSFAIMYIYKGST